jgi:hypothetical protein
MSFVAHDMQGDVVERFVAKKRSLEAGLAKREAEPPTAQEGTRVISA